MTTAARREEAFTRDKRVSAVRRGHTLDKGITRKRLYTCGMTGGVTLAAARRLPDRAAAFLNILEDVMAFQPAPACAQAVLRFGEASGGAFTHANVLNFRRSSNVAYNLSALNGLGEVLEDWFLDQGDANMSSAYQLLTIEIRGLDSQAAPFTTVAVNSPGLAAGDPLPPNVAACITLGTGLTGRSARGRMYWGGLSEVQSGGASLNSGNVTGINNMAADLLTRINADEGSKWVVLSREQNGTVLTNAIPYDITSAVLRDAVLDTQRRRINRLK